MTCGHLAAPGTEVNSPSAFGSYLKDHAVRLPQDCSLKQMVEWGWISPILRVALSRSALDSWNNFPVSPMVGTESCLADDRWTLTLWSNVVTSQVGLKPGNGEPMWWTHFLDDLGEPLTQEVLKHVIDPANPMLRPQPFQQTSSGREIAPWIDFFAYWQSYQVAELLGAVSFVIRATPEFNERTAGGEEFRLALIDAQVRRVKSRWQKRRSTYEWLSRFRVILAAWSSTKRPWSDVETAAHALAAKYRLTGPRVVTKIRNVLLVTWQDWANVDDVALPGGYKLRALLRQDIEYALVLAEILSGSEVDFLAPFWTNSDRRSRRWAQLIDALPWEAELARYHFPDLAMMYLESHVTVVPSSFSLDAEEIRSVISAYWSRSRPLRRFCLAFYRLHKELSDEDLGAEQGVVRSNERIEQLLLTVLNAEKLLVSIAQNRNGGSGDRKTRKIAKDQLNFTLGKFRLHGNDVGRKSREAAKRLLDAYADLYDLGSRGDRIFVSADAVESGSVQADYFVAAFVNFVIVRNYAAHHDSLDSQLVFRNECDVGEHQGRVALRSVLSVVITCLQLDR
ncbi:hypothetical protein ThimaDRAFT_4215 [Thiocapsa marina 5811]|uniref:Uncharacterized protein n=2 Tax=Thiocapsa marina TaxID=244573 RepID=F9UH42_9GAMM|nr:hypothetical protein ThimaDRAFT_4215 [Thiocapsa marina 5811]